MTLHYVDSACVKLNYQSCYSFLTHWHFLRYKTDCFLFVLFIQDHLSSIKKTQAKLNEMKGKSKTKGIKILSNVYKSNEILLSMIQSMIQICSSTAMKTSRFSVGIFTLILCWANSKACQHSPVSDVKISDKHFFWDLDIAVLLLNIGQKDELIINFENFRELWIHYRCFQTFSRPKTWLFIILLLLIIVQNDQLANCRVIADCT